MPSLIYAQSPALTRGPVSLATAHTTTHTGVQSLLANPAGLYNIENTMVKFSATTRYSESAFTTMDALIAIPLTYTTLEVSASHFGDDIFGIDRLSVAAGHRMGIASLGLRLHSFTYRTEATGSRTVVVAEAGGRAELSEKLSVGAWILNPGQARVSEAEYFPTMMSLGLAYKTTDALLLLIEAEKDVQAPATIKAGLHYTLNEFIRAMIGIQTRGHRLSAGISFYKSRFDFQYATAWTGLPGFRHQLGLGYQIQGK
ncbi:MAG: hypothetical protein WBB45_01680 [Cyclobacteriaceae bacterium]